MSVGALVPLGATVALVGVLGSGVVVGADVADGPGTVDGELPQPAANNPQTASAIEAQRMGVLTTNKRSAFPNDMILFRRSHADPAMRTNGLRSAYVHRSARQDCV